MTEWIGRQGHLLFLMLPCIRSNPPSRYDQNLRLPHMRPFPRSRKHSLAARSFAWDSSTSYPPRSTLSFLLLSLSRSRSMSLLFNVPPSCKEYYKKMRFAPDLFRTLRSVLLASQGATAAATSSNNCPAVTTTSMRGVHDKCNGCI